MGFDWDSSSCHARVYHALSSSHQRLPTSWISSGTPSPPPPDSRIPTTHQSTCRLGIPPPSASDAEIFFAGCRPRLLYGSQDHINNECAKRRSICIALLLLIRDLCVVFWVPSGSLPLVAPESQRRISPLEAAFSLVRVPWPALEVTPLWGPGDEPHGDKWPKCCGFVILPESQSWRSCGTGPLT